MTNHIVNASIKNRNNINLDDNIIAIIYVLIFDFIIGLYSSFPVKNY